MKAVSHLEKVVVGEASAVTHLEKVVTKETTALTYTEKVIAGEATPITHLQKVIAGVASPVTHLEHVWAGGSPTPSEYEYTGAVPVTITADGTPLLDYLISGNKQQTGTPTPENPVMPQGCGNKTANLWNAIKYTYTSLSDSSVWVYSSSLTGSVYRVPCMPNTKYTLYLAENVSISIWRICEVSTDAVPNASSTSVPTTGTYVTAVPASKSATFTTSATAKHILFQTNEAAYESVLPVIMLIEGPPKIPYEPSGYKIPISSANTTTPIYLGEVETTRKIRKLVLTGEENITKAASNPVFTMQLSGSNTPLSENAVTTLSTHYQAQNNTTGTGNVGDMRVCVRRGYGTMYIGDARYDNATDYKSYLASQYANGTPVTVWYVLATPETGIVNEPLMKIGDYADTLSMEQAGVNIPTLNGQTVVDVDTTLKPSEVYIKYKG